MLARLSRSYKVFTKEEVLKPFSGRGYKNLFEMASGHQNKGVGLKFWRKTWPDNSYFTLTKVEYDNMRLGRAWGVLTWEGISATEEKEIRGALKLGTWQYKAQDNDESR